jgi:hypothetical protein
VNTALRFETVEPESLLEGGAEVSGALATAAEGVLSPPAEAPESVDVAVFLQPNKVSAQRIVKYRMKSVCLIFTSSRVSRVGTQL